MGAVDSLLGLGFAIGASATAASAPEESANERAHVQAAIDWLARMAEQQEEVRQYKRRRPGPVRGSFAQLAARVHRENVEGANRTLRMQRLQDAFGRSGLSRAQLGRMVGQAVDDVFSGRVTGKGMGSGRGGAARIAANLIPGPVGRVVGRLVR